MLTKKLDRTLTYHKYKILIDGEAITITE